MNIVLFPPPDKPPPNMRCKNCIHMTRHQYNFKIKYCRLQTSNKTDNGLKKIGANDYACGRFEAIKNKG